MSTQDHEQIIFSKWLKSHEIVDSDAFAQTGGIVWLKNGVLIKKYFSELVSRIFTESGFTQVELPFFIPQDIYTIQPQHFEGLFPLTYRVISFDGQTSSFLRTTSETPFTHLFKGWLNQEQLPLKFFQVICVFRHEDSNRLKPLLRSREINPFIESYSAVATDEDAQLQVLSEINIYRKVLGDLGIPYLLNKRPLFDTFPEAKSTNAFDVILPDGQVFQIATVHHLGDSFGRAFNVKEKEKSYIFQTSTGISGRAIGCALEIHRNKDDLILPFSVSPRKFNIRNSNHQESKELCSIKQLIVGTGISQSDCINFSIKENQESWFQSGGCFDILLDDKYAVITSRSGEAFKIKKSEIHFGIEQAIKQYSDWLLSRADILMNNYICNISMNNAIEKGFKGIIQCPHCGEEICMLKIKDLLGNHGQVLGTTTDIKQIGSCEFCNKPALVTIRIALSRIDYH